MNRRQIEDAVLVGGILIMAGAITYFAISGIFVFAVEVWK